MSTLKNHQKDVVINKKLAVVGSSVFLNCKPCKLSPPPVMPLCNLFCRRRELTHVDPSSGLVLELNRLIPERGEKFKKVIFSICLCLSQNAVFQYTLADLIFRRLTTIGFQADVG